MESYAVYLIKVNVALIVLYAFYKFTLSKDTFFKLKRTILLLLCITSFVYPLVDFSNWMNEGEHPIGQAIATVYYKILPETLITASGTFSNIEGVSWMVGTWLWIIYGVGVGVLLLRTLSEITKIRGSLLRSRRCFLKGVSVCQSAEIEEPYSFFRWIFINPALHSDREMNEILIHEQTHVREFHSLDIILAQFMIIACWFNPFVWLICSEIRMNHEYLADKQVIASGYEKKVYQYHLLGIEHKSLAAANLYNNFSVLPLKKRIKMLNRKRTRNIMISKYLMFIPVVTLLIFFSNCANKSKEVQTDAETTEVVPATELEKTVEPEVKVVEAEVKDDIFEVVEHMPEYPGGTQELLKYLSSNIKYPANAEKNKIQGRVIIQFIVNKDGSVTNEKVVRSIDPELDAEALRVISSMPKWKPGMQKDEPVRVKYTVPVVFRVQ